MNKDKIYLFDDDHLNNYGGNYIAPYFKEFFNSIIAFIAIMEIEEE